MFFHWSLLPIIRPEKNVFYPGVRLFAPGKFLRTTKDGMVSRPNTTLPPKHHWINKLAGE